jgi:hypothetical protein
MNRTLVAIAIALTVIGAGLSTGCSRRETPDDPASAKASQAPVDHAAHVPPAEHDLAPSTTGSPWPTDEPLRSAMSRIRAAVVEQTSTADAGGAPDAAAAHALAATIEKEVAYIVANCKLPPAADTALHALIGRMMSASAALTADPTSTAGVRQLEAVLRDYGATFDHPGWTFQPRA